MTVLAILISGTGSNMEALMDRMDSGELDARTAFVGADTPAASGLNRAKIRGVPTHVLSYEKGRHKAEERLEELWKAHDLNWLVLAGFMKVLSPKFVSRHRGRIVNIHPALLPSFPGAHGIDDAWNAGVTVTGVTVHLVDAMVDHGPIVAQLPVRVRPQDNRTSLEKRIHRAEHRLYWRALRGLFSGGLAPRKDESA
ncbi:MAG: phosphoribosylglycinamide formyltransferase [Dethiosulfovibrio peptidovorans]|nr:MAG: phosphoribosylglycinamide formyltransferase [Dethiosulfovibrio peptidovorans]